jgi:hypothetical protein
MKIFSKVHVTVDFWVNKKNKIVLLPWRRGICSGHRVRLQNGRSRVQIPPGCKVLGNLYVPCSKVVIAEYELTSFVLEKNKCSKYF